MADGFDSSATTQDYYKDVINNAVNYVSAFMKIKGLDKISQVQANNEIRSYIPDGQDLVLGNLSNSSDAELFTMQCSILTSLILMQKKYYTDKETGLMRKGVIPAIEAYSSRLQYFVIRTRASGPDRERELHVGQHAIKNWLNQQNKPNPAEMVFGPTKNK